MERNTTKKEADATLKMGSQRSGGGCNRRCGRDAEPSGAGVGELSGAAGSGAEAADECVVAEDFGDEGDARPQKRSRGTKNNKMSHAERRRRKQRPSI